MRDVANAHSRHSLGQKAYCPETSPALRFTVRLLTPTAEVEHTACMFAMSAGVIYLSSWLNVNAAPATSPACVCDKSRSRGPDKTWIPLFYEKKSQGQQSFTEYTEVLNMKRRRCDHNPQHNAINALLSDGRAVSDKLSWACTLLHFTCVCRPSSDLRAHVCNCFRDLRSAGECCLWWSRRRTLPG